MGFRYNIKPSNQDSHQADHYWIAAVIPFAIKDTTARAFNDSLNTNFNIDVNLNTFVNISSDEANNNPVKIEQIYVIDNDIIRWQTSASKESHIASLNMTLLPDDPIYIDNITPEDWVIFWAFDNYTSYKLVKDNLLSNPIKPCNLFTEHENTAPKFIGRVDSVMLNKAVEPNSGRFSLTYSINCVGFGELDSSIYFDERIESRRTDAAMIFQDFSNVETQIAASTIITTQEAILGLLRIMLGIGPGEASKHTFLQGVSASPNEAYLIPDVVNSIIKQQRDAMYIKPGTYANLLTVLIGIQEYNANVSNRLTSNFLPKVDSGGHINIISEDFGTFTEDTNVVTSKSSSPSEGILKTYFPVSGTFNLPPLMFNNQPLWSVLKSFLIEPINEMYTCLKPDLDGRVGPTLVVRQLPLSTQEFKNGNKNQATAFLELPCWDIDSTMVSNIQVGRSSALRCNYVLIVPNDLSMDPQVNRDTSRFISNPIMDSADIRRAGLRAIIQNHPAANAESDYLLKQQGTFWNRLMADALFGSHLKYTGTITTYGISEPICQGDNCLVDGILYHIERVVHIGNIDANGRKTFMTNLQVSNGLEDDGGKDQGNAYPGIKKKQLLAGN